MNGRLVDLPSLLVLDQLQRAGLGHAAVRPYDQQPVSPAAFAVTGEHRAIAATVVRVVLVDPKPTIPFPVGEVADRVWQLVELREALLGPPLDHLAAEAFRQERVGVLAKLLLHRRIHRRAVLVGSVLGNGHQLSVPYFQTGHWLLGSLIACVDASIGF